MKIAVVRETRPAERRVALVPEQVVKLVQLGYEVAVEPAAGERALYSDDAYRDAGAEVAWGADHAATVVASVQPLERERLQRLHAGTALMSFLPTNPPDVIRAATRAKLTAFAMELIPRISRAQSMDALSSQALVAGYRAAIVAAERLPRFFPLNMTAAGTVPPAQVVVLGAGVAGLQAIATAKRLGAVVKAYDVRTAAAEEIASMGAIPIVLELGTLD
ncbi:MAG TPA: NAD(P)(+) transhydrogenase (Re/Si-specific) subunit alpha, partial [Kribbella sp.]